MRNSGTNILPKCIQLQVAASLTLMEIVNSLDSLLKNGTSDMATDESNCQIGQKHIDSSGKTEDVRDCSLKYVTFCWPKKKENQRGILIKV